MLKPKRTTLLHVEYASAAWNPFEKQHMKALEAVHFGAVRFVCSVYAQFSSVTSMQHLIGLGHS